MTTTLRGVGRRPLPPRDERDWVTSGELQRTSGITYRQLDYWCSTGLLTALPGETASARFSDLPITAENPGSGYTRRFHEDQVRRARLLRDLLNAGFALQVCRQIIDELFQHGRAQTGVLTVVLTDQAYLEQHQEKS